MTRRRGPAPDRTSAALALALFLAMAVEMATTAADHGPPAANLVVGAVVCGALAWRRAHPLAAVVAVAVSGVVLSAWLTHPQDLVTMLLALVTAAYSVAAHAPRRRALAGLGAALGAVAAVNVVTQTLAVDDFVFPVVLFSGAWFTGRGIRARAVLTHELRSRTEQLERERREREREAVAEERARIARELHDVVAHSVSVMVVQAGAARRVLARDPGRSVEALGAVETTGREALAEMRRLLGILRPPATDHAPAPSLSDLATLAERFRAAGLHVELDVAGEPGPLPAGVDLCAYRVVQEALTNAVKHAGTGRARVAVRWKADSVELEVANRRGRRTAAALAGTSGGHGLLGMRERVALCGGELEAGAADRGRFVVRARLPREPAAVPA
jgi:signal transduction histidine kinase